MVTSILRIYYSEWCNYSQSILISVFFRIVVKAREIQMPRMGHYLYRKRNKINPSLPQRGNILIAFCKEFVNHGSYRYRQSHINHRTMADTYTQIYIQFVFAVQNRTSLIRPEWEEELYKYNTGIVQNKSHKMIAINGMPDHLHMFVGFRPVDHISEFIKVVKGESSKWIKNRDYVNGRFRWQAGYGAFSYSRSHIDRVYHYIMNQKKHHQTRSFLEEYTELLKKFDVDFNDRYIFKSVDY